MIMVVGPQLSQWDVGRIVSVSKSNATHVHFANQGDAKAVIIELVEGSAKIPDYLLQTGKTVLAYEVLNGVTLGNRAFAVRKRERPENYVYEDDHRNYIYEWITNAEKAAEAANLATQNANEAAAKAIQAANSWVMIGDASGERMVVSDAIDQNFAGFRIYGKTTQDGVPTPDAPVELVSVENPTIMVNDQSALVPYTLHGIPVTSGGNYTDANGQQWICDEIDFGRGVYVHRVSEYITPIFGSNGTASESVYLYSTFIPNSRNVLNTKALSTHFKWTESGALSHMLVGQMIVRDRADYPVIYCASTIAVESEFNAWVKENNVSFLSILATPIETPLSAEALAAYAALHTSRGRTDISNDAGAWMKCEYFMDAKKYIDSKISGVILAATVE